MDEKFIDDGWGIYESNLQAYRSNFLSSQSIMLAIGAILIDASALVSLLLSAIALIQMFYVWIPVIHYRAILVDFHKYRLNEKFTVNGEWKTREDEEPLTELIYCKNKKIRKNVNYIISQKVSRERPFSNWRETRRKIDIIIPLSMTFIWILYDLHVFNLI